MARTKMVEMLKVWGSGGIGGSYARDWPLWPGRWGNSLGEGKSPMAPISQGDRWDQPGAFAEQAEACPREEEGEPQARIQGGMIRRPSAPQVPAIRAQLRNHKAIVHYKLEDAPIDQKQGVEIAVLADKAIVTPVKRAAWTREGTLSLPLPSGEGPYTVVARSLSSSGAGSPKVTVEIGTWDRGIAVPHTRDQQPAASSRDYSDALLDSSFVQRLGASQAKALQRWARRVRRINRRMQSAPAPAVVRALGDREGIGRR